MPWGTSAGLGGGTSMAGGGALAGGGRTAGGGASGAYNAFGAGGVAARANPQTTAGLSAARDAANYGGMDRLGALIASILGLGERPPQEQATRALLAGQPVPERASWGFDPATLAGTALGTAFGIPGLGYAADQASEAAGRPLDIDLGPDVFGGAGGGGTAKQGQAGRGGGEGNPNQLIQALIDEMTGVAAPQGQPGAPQGAAPTAGPPRIVDTFQPRQPTFQRPGGGFGRGNLGGGQQRPFGMWRR